MPYSIGEVEKMTGIAISTLRFYDREGMFLTLKRSTGGIRMFSDTEIEAIKIIECLKVSGMSIKDIKAFLRWCQEGDASLQKRRDMFHERLDVVSQQMAALQKTMEIIRYKRWYYDTALAAGTEKVHQTLAEKDLPDEILRYKRAYLGEKGIDEEDE